MLAFTIRPIGSGCGWYDKFVPHLTFTQYAAIVACLLLHTTSKGEPWNLSLRVYEVNVQNGRTTGQELTSSLDLSGRRYACEREHIRFECEARNATSIIWTSDEYIGRAQIYFGSDERVNIPLLKSHATAVLSDNSVHQGSRSNLTSQLTVEVNSSGTIGCRSNSAAPPVTMSIVVSG